MCSFASVGCVVTSMEFRGIALNCSRLGCGRDGVLAWHTQDLGFDLKAKRSGKLPLKHEGVLSETRLKGPKEVSSDRLSDV